MRGASGRELSAFARALAIALLVAGCGLFGSTSRSPARNVPQARLPAGELLHIGPPKAVHPIRSGFLGLSLEYTAIEHYAGTNPSALNPVLLQLIRNLTPNQSPVLRIGGDTTDWTWYRIAGMSKPRGIRITLDPLWIRVMAALTRSLNAKLIMGLNLEADNDRVITAEARAFVRGIGRKSIAAFEPGNEPELYASWPWYLAPDGSKVTGRPPGWDFPQYEQEFARIAHTLTAAPIAGPAAGSAKWMAYIPAFLRDEQHIGMVTVHRYPLQSCYTPADSPLYPTITHMLAPDATLGIASSVAPYVPLAHARHVPLRVDEFNTDGCGSTPSVDGSFASALWALDTTFAMAYAGVDGVNVHTYPLAAYRLFSFTQSHGRWLGQVRPEYYGLLLFALAAPPGSKPLRVWGPAQANLRIWATRGADHQTRVVLINESDTTARTVLIRHAGTAPATAVRLRAPGLGATGHVTLAGQSFGASTATGVLAGNRKTFTVRPGRGVYPVYVSPAGATLVTLP